MRLRLAAVTTLVIAVICCSCYGDGQEAAKGTATEVASPDAVTQMVAYAKQGRYEEAVQLGLRSLHNQPNDAFIYQQIADVYLIRAQKDPDRRQQWTSQAVINTEKALSLSSKVEDAAGANLFQIARSYEFAGDLSAGDRCTYYGRARNLLEDRNATLKGDHVTVGGKTFPLAPLQRENEKVLAEVKAKIEKAGCKPGAQP